VLLFAAPALLWQAWLERSANHAGLLLLVACRVELS
jgi:hypothetical protein